MNTAITYEKQSMGSTLSRLETFIWCGKAGQRRFRQLCILFSVLFVLTVWGIHHLGTIAQADEIPSGREKYFTSIQIENGDSLWSIAETYISPEYESISDYVEELKSMNGMTDSRIYAGDYLTIAYYK